MTRRVAFAFLVLLLGLAGVIEFRLHHRTAQRDAAFARFDVESPSLIVTVLDGARVTDVGELAAAWEKAEYDRETEHLSNVRKPVWCFAGVLGICGLLMLKADRRRPLR